MPSIKQDHLSCFVAIPHSKGSEKVRAAITEGILKAGFQSRNVADVAARGMTAFEGIYNLVAMSDCVIVDLSNLNSNVIFELGIAQAMGKAIFPLVEENALISSEFGLDGYVHTTYSRSALKHLSETISLFLNAYRNSPRSVYASGSRARNAPFFVDWTKIEQTDAENLCRELLSHMGLLRVEWFKESWDVDLIAEYPRKDPDGFEYRELWLVSTGRSKASEMMLEMAFHDAEELIHFTTRGNHRFEKMLRDRDVIPITFLWIDLKGEGDFDMLRKRLSPDKRRRYSPSVRMRFWDRDYLTRLVQQFPIIGYKYFSDEGRSQSKYRKGPDELYKENVKLNENLAKTIVDLQEEKNLRIRAERDAVWKDISFSAAHKIGNPVFAIETNLDPLQKRIEEDRKEDAVDVVTAIRGSIEKAKGIVEQFKSLTKAQQITPLPTLLRPILEDSCRVLEAKSCKCVISCDSDLTVFGDPERLTEVFDELANNATHWIDKDNPNVTISAKVAVADELPQEIDSSKKYVLVHFQDNGQGVAYENKSRIFEAFFSTYDQGTGIGLALVRRIVEGHGGVVFERGRPGVGADFEIYLPLVEEIGE